MKIGYITTPYFGKRRTLHPACKNDETFYVKKHIEYLNEQTVNVDRVYFVCTFGDGIDRSPVLEKLNHLCKDDDRYVIVERENLGASYASWKHGLHIDNGYCDYLILAEDDYCLYDKDSVRLMLDFFKDDTDLFYLCQYWTNRPYRSSKLGIIKEHAAMASGMIDNKRYYHLRESKGLDFTIFYESTYKSFCDNQAIFLEEYRRNGMKIKDWTKIYSSYFPNSKIEYGNKNGRKLMIPLQDDLGYF